MISVAPTSVARTLTRTSPGPGSGKGNSTVSSTSGPPFFVSITACIVATPCLRLGANAQVNSGPRRREAAVWTSRSTPCWATIAFFSLLSSARVVTETSDQKTYRSKLCQNGISLSKEAMRVVEARLQRNPILAKWDIPIRSDYML